MTGQQTELRLARLIETSRLLMGAIAPDDLLHAVLEAVVELLAAGAPRRVAADVVARLTGVPRNRLYRGSL